MSVHNTELPAKNGKDIPVKLGKNTVFDKKKQQLYATIDGQLSITENGKINAFPVFEVNGDLDFSVGNIDFIGNVVIRGNVPVGFKIKAKGDIRVSGGVEGAILEAEGSILIQSGVTAQNKGYIHAGHDIKTTFVSNGKLFAEGNIMVSQAIMHSEVTALKEIHCLGSKGLIVGGLVQAGLSIKCRNIGNNMATPTVIEVGSNPTKGNELKELRLQLQEQATKLDKTMKAIQILNQLMRKIGTLPSDKQAMLEMLKQTKEITEKTMLDIETELMTIEEELDQLPPATVEVSSYIYQGTKLVFGRYIRFIRNQEKAVKFLLKNSEIVKKNFFG